MPRPKGASVSVPRLLNEAPEVVGSMSMVVGNGGSLDSAVRAVAADGPPISAGMFLRVADKADTRVESDMRASLSAELSRLPEGASPYCMAVHMVASASDARDPGERDRMLRDASEIALAGLKEAGKEYSASLGAPCTAIFAIGIMIPMLLMSVLPMLGVGGVFGASTAGVGPIAFVTLVAVPAAVAAVALAIRGRSPFPGGSGGFDARLLLPLLAAAPAYAVALSATGDVATSMCAGGIAGGLLCLAAVSPRFRAEALREKREAQLKDAVFEAGNRLVSGEPFEEAVARAVADREDCGPLAAAVRRELAVCRGDVRSALMGALSPVSRSAAERLCWIHRASTRDLRDAGRLAISVGRQLKDQEAVRRGIRSDLRGMTDAMFGTASVFAPMVLGLSVSMLAPVSELSGSADPSGTSVVLVAYLAELCALLSFLISFLDGRTSAEHVARRMSVMLTLSMAVFAVCASVGLRGGGDVDKPGARWAGVSERKAGASDPTELCRSWCRGDPVAIRYHDARWCRPCHDDGELFAMLCLEGQQAGLSWALILRREEGMREVFDGFDPRLLAEWDDARVEAALADPRIVRNRAKVRSVVANARAYLRLLSEGGCASFDEYVWHFTGGRTVVRHPASLGDVPAEDALSREVSRDLKRRGFSFVGPVTVYSFLQAVGVVDDHVEGCRFKPAGGGE